MLGKRRAAFLQSTLKILHDDLNSKGTRTDTCLCMCICIVLSRARARKRIEFPIIEHFVRTSRTVSHISKCCAADSDQAPCCFNTMDATAKDEVKLCFISFYNWLHDIDHVLGATEKESRNGRHKCYGG